MSLSLIVHYIYITGEVKKTLKWADGKDVKSEIDVQVNLNITLHACSALCSCNICMQDVNQCQSISKCYRLSKRTAALAPP